MIVELISVGTEILLGNIVRNGLQVCLGGT